MLEEADILSFRPLESVGLEGHYLVCATEMNTKRQMDDFIAVLRRIQNER